MRISDWSSDVCSSDLLALEFGLLDAGAGHGDRVAGLRLLGIGSDGGGVLGGRDACQRQQQRGLDGQGQSGGGQGGQRLPPECSAGPLSTTVRYVARRVGNELVTTCSSQGYT